ncbi:aminodeoxychorismate synthase component I [Sphingomonas jatrophae]|uniref:Probable branched-chain-amino-acid aminotransferase n=1 Tax=Sphingomonas jatrophae TaxID=1166337 RepID=A0A1I6M6B9_9SPHN|nr:aminodeoxychorismate synthase component I [Sphingomonas jatrophae]SFS11236.1 para-aminobenzoate synthetase / 4-amino-4-deoxychorismate lyase [Sphingomonas jatrophae]
MTLPAPFVLLDDVRAAGGPPRLYEAPGEVIVAHAAEEVAPALERLREALAEGAHAAGFLGYEAGYTLSALHTRHPELVSGFTGQPGTKPQDRASRWMLKQVQHDGGAPPILWVGLFDRVRLLDPAGIAAWLPDPAGACAGPVRPRIDEAAHAGAVARILDYIAAGDIYQANLTFAASVRVAGDPRALYARLRATGGGGWGGIVWTGGHWLLSCSPELFFTAADGALTARPMKGTLPASADPTALAADPKQRAENLMIVDLIRNDLAQVAEPGSVSVPDLFAVETYPTVHQMTSTVIARLAPGRDAVDLLAAAFPCGSVTGAPKRRAMEIIAELEPHPRGPYTGSIGWLDPAGNGGFNVAIRTLVLGQGEEHATLGLGSGIVADSVAADEWRECLAKAAFMSAAEPAFDLIETMRFDPSEGIAELDRHLARMKASADAFGFAFDRHDARNELQAATFRLRAPSRLRLLLGRSGAIAIEAAPAPAPLAEPVAVAIVPLPVAPSDVRLRHKTSDRGFYDAARAAAGTAEVVFVDPEGFLTEGSFTSLFVERGGRLLTPPLARGLLPGVLRARLLAEVRAEEADLRPEDLVGGFLIGNALRGLMRAELTSR